MLSTRNRSQKYRSYLILGDRDFRRYDVSLADEASTIVDAHTVDLAAFDMSPERAALALVNTERPVRMPIIVLSDHLYRTQMEFLPPTSRRNALKVLNRLARLEETEFLLAEKLATSTADGNPVQAWQSTAVRTASIDAVCTELDRGQVKVKKILVDQDLAKRAALYHAHTRKVQEDMVFVAVGQDTLDLTYIVKDNVAFTRRMAFTAGSDIARRISSEIRRTSVYFHRKFPHAEATRALVHVMKPLPGNEIVDEIKTSDQFTEVTLLESESIEVSPGVEVRGADSVSIHWLTELKDSEIARIEAVETPNQRDQRSRRRIAPTLAVACLIILGLPLLYLLSLSNNVQEYRTLHEVRSESLQQAKQTISRWDEIARSRALVLKRAQAVDTFLKHDLDIPAAMNGIAAFTPSEVRIESMEIARDLASNREEAGTPDGWSGRIVFIADLDYFEAKSLIEQTEAAFRRAPFLEGTAIRTSIAGSSLPWQRMQEQDNKPICRFVLRFWSIES